MDENINLTASDITDPSVDASSNPIPFKILKGDRKSFKSLEAYNEGTMYYCTNTGELFIAQKGEDGQVQAKEIGQVGKNFAVNSNEEIASNGNFAEVNGEIFNDYINNRASGMYSHAEGFGTTASNTASHAEGRGTGALAVYSHAEGYNTTASNSYSHAEGYSTEASGSRSHAEGYNTTASGNSSHAEGYSTTASSSYSHAEGRGTTASGIRSHAEGSNTTASNYAAHAEGDSTEASGDSSHAEGYETEALGDYQHVQGKYNISDTTSAHIVGNGTSTNRKNIHTLNWNGTAWFAGDVFVGSAEGKNKDGGSKKLATEEFATNAANTVKQELQEVLDNKQNKGNYLVTDSSNVQCVTGGLVIGKSTTAGISGTGTGRIMFTGQSNPLIGIQAIAADGTAKTPFYVQAIASDDTMCIGPTSTRALKFDSNGNMTSPANLSIGGSISEGGTLLSNKYATKIEVSNLIHIGNDEPNPRNGAVLWINPSSGLKYWDTTTSQWLIVPVAFM